jgi:uncharacterized Zn-binding protein involved in type VI secretion
LEICIRSGSVIGMRGTERMPKAARVGDAHTCKHNEPIAHRGGPILDGCATVLIGELPAARVGDHAWCDGGAFDVISLGEETVVIGGRPAARAGDRTDGGVIAGGLGTVRIGRRRRGRRPRIEKR